jgi:hypothetical protein
MMSGGKINKSSTGRRKEEGGRRKEEGGRRKEEGDTIHLLSIQCHL